MFIFYALNYPCNDSTYFWHIVSVSKETLENPNKCDSNNGKFVQKIMPSLLGVNCTYNESIKTSEFGKCCYIVDLDHKAIIRKVSSSFSDRLEKEDFDKSQNILSFFDSVFAEKKITSKFLKDNVSKLYKDLNEIVNTIKLEKNEINVKEINFFNMNDKIKLHNKEIQEAFYDFYLSILMIFYQDNCINNTYDKIVKDIDGSHKRLNFLQNSGNFSNEEEDFCSLFKDSVKYKIYLENFIRDSDCLDVYKIPLIFSEEFINMKMVYTQKKFNKKLSYFDWIDKFYGKTKSKILGFSLSSIHNKFKENFGKISKFFKKENTIILKRKLINIYMNYISNNDLDKNIHKYIITFEETKNIDLINRRKISEIIENELIESKIINPNGLLFYSSIFIFCILLNLNDQSKMVNHLAHLRECFDSLYFLSRKYFYIILMTYFKFMLIQKKTNKYPNMSSERIQPNIWVILNYLSQKNIVPNEEMLYLYKSFLKDNKEKEQEQIILTEDENDIDPNDKSVFQMYVAYCFNKNGIIKEEAIVKSALLKPFIENVTLNVESNEKEIICLHPEIVIRIKDLEFISKMYNPRQIYNISKKMYEKFFESENLDIYILDQIELKKIIVNLILYGYNIVKLDDKNFFPIPYLFLVNNLYHLLENEKKQENQNSQNNDNKINENINNNINTNNDNNTNIDNITNTNTNLIENEKSGLNYDNSSYFLKSNYSVNNINNNNDLVKNINNIGIDNKGMPTNGKIYPNIKNNENYLKKCYIF